MKKIHYLFGIMLLMIAGYAVDVNAQVSNDNEDEVNKIDKRTDVFVPGEVLVKFKDESIIKVHANTNGGFRAASVSTVDLLLKKFGVSEMEKLFPLEEAKTASQLRSKRAPNGELIVEKNLDKVYWIKTHMQSPDSTLQLIEQLNSLPDVDYAEPNYYLFISASCTAPLATAPISQSDFVGNMEVETTANNICTNPSQNPLYNDQYGITQHNIQHLWNKQIINKRRPVIAIVDTGVDITHPDLVNNIWTNLGELEGDAGYDDDRNGYRDDINGWNFIDNNNDVTDLNRHGTHCAGIAAAVDNNLGIIGANPLARIMPVRVLDASGRGSIATVAKGIVYAAKNGADIISMSLGGPTLTNVQQDALDFAYQTSIIVAAAGNNGSSIYNQNLLYSGRIYPGAYHLVLGVESTDKGGNRSSYSNYDPDGPVYSTEGVDGCNYEVQVAGRNIISTLPNGNYGRLSGTSMSTPLMAGAISALMMVKDYPSRDALWGDLIHLKADFEKIYSNETERKAMVDLVTMDIDDSEGNKNGKIDVGETVKFSPVLRNTWETATGIRLKLTVEGQYENDVTILNPEMEFGNDIPLYGVQTPNNPFLVTFNNNIACNNDTKIKFFLEIRFNENQDIVNREISFNIYNMVEISGVITKDIILTADRIWLVSSNLAIPEGKNLTIEPGAIIRLGKGVSISSKGHFVAIGTPQKKILFTKLNDGDYWGEIYTSDRFEYCVFEYAKFTGNSTNYNRTYKNCIFTDCIGGGTYQNQGILSYTETDRCNYYNLQNASFYSRGEQIVTNANFVNNLIGYNGYHQRGECMNLNGIENSNYFNNCDKDNYSIAFQSEEPIIQTINFPSYLGTSKESIARQFILDINSGYQFGSVDLSNMLTQPVSEAHGIVWKVCVNGKDAQDEYEDLAPLGVGEHKFEVYFNRPMNKAVSPKISFGLVEPYTQQEVAENGSWNEEGTIYTAYKTINGKTNCDGVNRIYVYGAEDNEYFEIPYENTRFNIQINAAGTLATGFAAEACMGRVKLTWDNENNDFEDAMGYNVYRFTEATIETPTRINMEVLDIETTEYTDYDVVPGTTYYYMYKVLSTDLKEFDVSNVVAATPLTSELGDANGSGDVDVNDVITTVNYAAGMDPKPFIFEAADMNTDQMIDILDVIGIIQKILNPNAAPAMASVEAAATYTIEDGMLYVDSPVALAGVQVQINLDGKHKKEDVRVAGDLDGFEHASAWLSDNDYLFLAFNMNGKVLPAGKHALLKLDDADLSNIVLSDAQGHNVLAIAGNTTGIDAMGSKVMQQDGVFNLKGQKVAGKASDLQTLPKGVYIVNGEKVVK